MACSEHKKTAIEVAEKTSELKKEGTTRGTSGTTIASYDFNSFEQEFLQQIDDETYVINFWATWCKPCIKELPAFEQLHSTYEDKKVKVILVSLDFPEKLETHVVPFVKKYKLASHVILLDEPDGNSWIPKVSEEWSGAIPATLMVKNGMAKFYERPFTYEELENELKTIL